MLRKAHSPRKLIPSKNRMSRLIPANVKLGVCGLQLIARTNPHSSGPSVNEGMFECRQRTHGKIDMWSAVGS